MTGFLQKSAAFALALLTLLSCAACAGETGPVTTPSSESTTVSPTTDPPAFVSSGKTYDGQSFIILMSGFAPETFNDFNLLRRTCVGIIGLVNRREGPCIKIAIAYPALC